MGVPSGLMLPLIAIISLPSTVSSDNSCSFKMSVLTTLISQISLSLFNPKLPLLIGENHIAKETDLQCNVHISFRNNIAKRHDEFERHAEGTFTSDLSAYLEDKAVKEFIAWLVKGRDRQE